MPLSWLSPRAAAVFGLIAAAVQNTVDAAAALREVCDRYPERLAEASRLHELERRGDGYVAELGTRLQQALATPVDARDLVAVAVAVDDIVDAIDDAGDALMLFAPVALPEQARAQARVLLEACERLADASVRLQRFPDLSQDVADLRALEDEGDRLRRDATAWLFHSGLDPIEIMRLKSVHEALERAIDATRGAADAMATLAIKNRW